MGTYLAPLCSKPDFCPFWWMTHILCISSWTFSIKSSEINLQWHSLNVYCSYIAVYCSYYHYFGILSLTDTDIDVRSDCSFLLILPSGNTKYLSAYINLRYLACIKEDAPASILLWSPLGTHIQFMNNEVKVGLHTEKEPVRCTHLWISFYPPINKFKSSLNCFSVLWYQLPDKYQRHGRAIRYPETGQECLSSDIWSVTYISDVITRSCSCSWNVSSKLDKSRIYLHIYLVFSSCILGSHYFVNLLALKFFTINPLYKVGRWTQGGLFHYNTFDILKPWPGHWPGLFWESKLWFVMLLGMVSKTF